MNKGLEFKNLKILKGKTILKILEKETYPGKDDGNTLVIVFTDNSSLEITGTYGGYTGNSEDEYPAHLFTKLNK